MTDANGRSDRWIEYVEITKGALPAQKIDPNRLKPGMVLDAYSKGSLDDLSFAENSVGDVVHEISNWFYREEKKNEAPSLKRYTGWFEIAQTGQFELRIAGPQGESVLLIDGVKVIDTPRTLKYSRDQIQPYLQQRCRVFLEKCWHRFELFHRERRHYININGEGVAWKNEHCDIGPVYHTEEQARGANCGTWIDLEITSEGRPLAVDGGGIPKRFTTF